MASFPLNIQQNSIPIQMVPLKDKDEDWKKANLDAFESIGRKQFLENINILENYRMVNNEMLYNHYFFTSDSGQNASSATDLAQLAVKEFEVPPYLRHYDITRKIINVLSGEYQKRPDIFRVAGVDQFSQNEFLRQKSELLQNTVISQIQQRVQQQLIAEGFDPEKVDFASQEEAAQYQQGMEERAKALTPKDIELYMQESYRSVPESWGEMIIKLDKQRFNTSELEMVEFEDMLICDRAYRHFYLKANGLGYGQETWNPIRVFFHKSPDIKYVEDGDYVGRVFYLSLPEIISRYGHKMTKAQLESLYGDYFKNKKYGGAEYAFFQATNVPFETYPEYARTVQAFGFDPHSGVPFTGGGNYTSQDVDVLFNSSSTTYNLQGLVQATEVYWKSMKKVGFLVVQDPETGELIEELVDETFEVPDYVVEVDDDVNYKDFVFYPEKKINTIRWTWVNEVWGGAKVNLALQKKDRKMTDGALYIDIKPMPFQFKGDTNPYECKLPVCGAIFNNRNAKSMSLVDMMKPYQILYNVFMNKIYQLASTEVGKFLLLDPRMIPNGKDWGGEKNLEKWRTATKEYKIGQIDTSPGARAGGTQFNQFTVQDLREFDNIKATVEIARMIEEQAMFQVGITQARLGNIQASESATGVTQSVNNSYSQTESYFTKFGNYKKRVLQMNLDIAQYCSATNSDMTLSMIQDDMSREFIKINGVDLLISQLGIRVFNSQELLRQTEMLKQLVLNNNTTQTPLSGLAAIIYNESPAKIVALIKASEEQMRKDAQAERDHQQQMQQAQIQANQEATDKQNAWQAEQNQLDREASIQEKVISVTNFDTDTQDNGVIDVLNMGKLALEEQRLRSDEVRANQENMNKALDTYSKNKVEREKLENQKQLQAREAKMKERELASKERVIREQGKQAEREDRTQLRLAEEKAKAEMALKNKDLELKDKDIELKKVSINTANKTASHEIAGSKDSLNTDKTLNKEKVNQTKAINKLKLATAKKLEAQKVKDAKKPKPKPTK